VAQAGAAAVFLGVPPSAQPGLFDAETGDAAVRDAMARAQAASRVRRVDLGDDVPDVLAAIGVDPTLEFATVPQPLRAIARDLDDGASLVFVRNPSATAQEVVVTTDVPCVDARWADPWSGAVSTARRDASGRIEIGLSAYGSGFLLCDVPPPPEDLATAFAARAVPATVARTVPVAAWSLEVDGAPIAAGDDGVLGDWRDRAELAGAFGPGTYRATVALPALEAGERAFLDLGRVAGVARVSADGTDLGAAQVPPFRVALPDGLAGTTVGIEVSVVPPARNGLIALAASGDPTVSQYTGKEDTRIAAGLLGPVVVEVRR